MGYLISKKWTAAILSRNPLLPKPWDLSHRIQDAHEDARWAMKNHSLFDNGEILAAAIQGKYAIAVSDGLAIIL